MDSTPLSRGASASNALRNQRRAPILGWTGYLRTQIGRTGLHLIYRKHWSSYNGRDWKHAERVFGETITEADTTLRPRRQATPYIPSQIRLSQVLSHDTLHPIPFDHQTHFYRSLHTTLLQPTHTRPSRLHVRRANPNSRTHTA